MSEEYNLQDSLFFPDELYDKYIEGYHIIVASEYPNWLVLNGNEYRMFCWLKKGVSIRSTLENYYEQFYQDEKVCLNIMTGLLAQIENANFKRDASIIPEEPIESIKKRIHIGTTNGCNMRCEHCYMSAGMLPLETIDLQKTIQLVSDMNKIYGELEVVVSGGEPLTYSNIETLLKAIKKNHIILFTNSVLISEQNIEVISECCNEVQISFEGVSREIYSKVRGEENYDIALQAIELLKSHNVKIVLAITILPDTLSDIQKNLIRFINKINYDNLEVRLSDEIEMSGNALQMDLSGYEKKKSKAVVIELIKKLSRMGCTVQKNELRNTPFTNCGIGTNVVINFDGKIYPCHKSSKFSLPIGTNALKVIEVFNRINVETSVENIYKCQACELRYICSGGCRIDNFMKTGNMTKVICNEAFKEEQYKRLLYNYKMYEEKREDNEKQF